MEPRGPAQSGASEAARVVLIQIPLTGKAHIQQMAILAAAAAAANPQLLKDHRRARGPSIEQRVPQQLLETCAALGE